MYSIILQVISRHNYLMNKDKYYPDNYIALKKINKINKKTS